MLTNLSNSILGGCRAMVGVVAYFKELKIKNSHWAHKNVKNGEHMYPIRKQFERLKTFLMEQAAKNIP
jgi:hypothetical protein